MVRVTFRRAAELRTFAVRTTTQHTLGFCRIRSLRVNHAFFRILSVPVLAPLPYIAVHVVKTPGVRRESAGRRAFPSILAYLAVAIDVIASVIRLIAGNRFPKMERRRRSCTTGIFPLRFRGKPTWFLVPLPQLLDERLAVVPRN